MTGQHSRLREHRKEESKQIPQRDEELLKATKEENVLTDCNGETDTQHKHRLRQDHKDEWMMKSLRGQFLSQTREAADSEK